MKKITPRAGEATKRFTFEEIHKLNYLSLKIGLMWPNPGRDRVRYILIALESLFMLPFFVVIANDVRLCVLAADVPNFIRQLIVLIAISYVRVKVFKALYSGGDPIYIPM